MQTSTPSTNGKKSKKATALNISPVCVAQTEQSGGKVYSRRTRKPRKWDDFETETSSQPQEKKNSSKRSKALEETCVIEGNIVAVPPETSPSLTKVSPEIREKSARKNSKGRSNAQEIIISEDLSAEQDGKAENSTNRKNVLVTKTKLLTREKEELHRNKKPSMRTNRAENYRTVANIDVGSDLDEKKLEAMSELNNDEIIDIGKVKSNSDSTGLKILDKEIPSSAKKGLDKPIKEDNPEKEGKTLKNDTIVEQQKNVNRPMIKVLETESNKTDLGTEITETSLNVHRSKTPGRKRKQVKETGPDSSILDHDMETETESIKTDLSTELTNINLNSYKSKTSGRKRKGKQVKKATNQCIEIHNVTENVEETPHCKPGRRRGAKRKGSTDVESADAECNNVSLCSVSGGSSRKGRKRKEINYAELETGDVDDSVAEPVEKGSSRKRKKGTVRDLQNSQNGDTTNDNSLIDETQGKKRGPKKGPSYKCQHCQYEARGVTAIQNHYAIEHQLWWTEECPEGSFEKSDYARIIKIKSFLNCPKCDKQINFATYFPNHIEWCGREQLTYTCSYCNKKNLILRWQNLHLKTCPGLMYQASLERKKKEKEKDEESEEETSGRGKRRKAAKRALTMVHDISKNMEPSAHSDESDADPDAEISDDEEDDLDDDDINGDIDEEEEDIETPVEDDDDDGIVYSDDDRDESTTTTTSTRFSNYFNCFPLMEEFVKEHWSHDLFLDWLPWKQDWVQLSEKESEKLLPSRQTSIRFSYNRRKDPTTLEMFQSQNFEDSPSFFTGLSVWKVAWCPMPLSTKDWQYLAVVGKLDQSQHFYTNKQCEGKCVIQIWNTGVENNNMTSTALPKLSYSLIHDYGQVTKIVWCPSGCYRTKKQTVEREAHERLGLLAVSSTDGICRIFSLPLLTDTDTGQYPSFHAKPLITLLPSMKYKGTEISCSSIDWLKATGHSKIVTGYSNGTVRLFNLLSKSPLHCVKEKDGLKILPYINLQPHGNLVRAVSFCSTAESQIVSTSEDFECYFLDLHNLGSPIHDDGGYYMTMCIASSVFQQGVYIGCDDNYAHLINKGRYVDSSHLTYIMGKPEHRKEDRGAYYISSQPACIWDIDCSDWISIVATCDNRGSVCGLLVKDLMNIWPDCKSYRYRQVFLRTKVIEEKEEKDEEAEKEMEKQCNSVQEGCEKCNKTNHDSKIGGQGNRDFKSEISQDVTVQCDCKISSSRSKETSHTRKDLQKKYVVKDYETIVRKSILQFEEHHKVAKFCPIDSNFDTYDRPSVASIKSLSLNPNQYQCCWMAYGGDPGLIRLVNLQKILPRNTFAHLKTNKVI